MSLHVCSRAAASPKKCGGNNKGGTRDRALYVVADHLRSCFVHLTDTERRVSCGHSLAPTGTCSHCGTVGVPVRL